MQGDFTRDSFDPAKGFTRVMMQQGRPQIDADWNEQVAIFWEFWRTFTSDFVGPHAGPERNCGFSILAEGDFPLPEEAGMTLHEQEELQKKLQGSGDFLIGAGHYYVDGMRSSNAVHSTYLTQPALPGAVPLDSRERHHHLVYLDVWERHISDLEDDTIREVALLGTDTCTRAKLVWQVRSFPIGGEDNPGMKKVDCSWVREEWSELVGKWQSRHRGRLRARAGTATEAASLEPTFVAPSSTYRGPANQLYRVEIHHGGSLGSGDVPTFKFSRENGSVIFPVAHVAGPVVTVANLGRDAAPGLAPGDWVELSDDDYLLGNRGEPLLQVDKVDAGKMQVTLKRPPISKVGQDATKHALLRRWDQKQGDPRRGGLELDAGGAALIKEANDDNFWLTLEEGVQIQFRRSEESARYRSGDYWTIPARVATGNIVWPLREGKPEALGPHGVLHHYAPLAIVAFNKQDILETQSDCRLQFKLPVTPK